jgi:hypothetical protein
MPAKKNTTETTPLVSAPPPSARRNTKGAPAATNQPAAAMGNHTQKAAGSAQVDFNMKVPASFKVAVDTFLAQHSKSRKSYVMELIEADMKAKGWTPNN